MSYDDVLELPLKVFTLYNTNINRLRAEEEGRTLKILLSSQSSDSDYITSIAEALKEEMGTIMEHEREASGFVAPEPNFAERLRELQNVR